MMKPTTKRLLDALMAIEDVRKHPGIEDPSRFLIEAAMQIENRIILDEGCNYADMDDMVQEARKS